MAVVCIEVNMGFIMHSANQSRKSSSCIFNNITAQKLTAIYLAQLYALI
jgi:hypothetical protein